MGSRRRIIYAILFLSLMIVIESIASVSAESLIVRRRSTPAGTEDPYEVVADYGSPILVNTLSLGMQVTTWFEMGHLEPTSALVEKASRVHFKLIRVFVNRDLKPCTQWNQAALSGKYNWQNFDAVISFAYQIGAEPMLNLDSRPQDLPNGMQVDPNTKLPDPQSFATYAADIAAHAKNKGWQIRYWEVLNEPQYTLNHLRSDQNELSLFVSLFNVVAARIHQTLPNALVGTDASNYKSIFDYLVTNAQGVGFLSFHKYDAAGTWLNEPAQYLSENDLLVQASNLGNNPYRSELYYTPNELQQIWRQTHDQDIPVICSETNMNSASTSGTDPRIQQMLGTVWYAEELRAFILAGVQYSVWYHFASNEAPNWETTRQTRGAGFGMVNSSSPYVEWYPYWTNYIFGNNLNPGDTVVNSQSSNETALSTIAWHSQDRYVLIMISKLQSSFAVNVALGLPAGAATHVDVLTINSDKPTLQSNSLPYEQKMQFTMSGYSVVALIVTY